MTKLHIVIGPMKTGTTWLHNLVAKGDADKEIKFPVRLLRSYVYRKFVEEKSLLIWPYLLHNPKNFRSLIEWLEREGRDYTLYATWRKKSDWQSSMQRFRERSTIALDEQDLDLEIQTVMETLSWAKSKGRLRCLRLIDARPRDLTVLSQITGLSVEVISAQLSTRVYETRDSARVNSRKLGLLFFSIKPFLPAFIRRLNRRSFGLGFLFYRRPPL
jgi:hypothetical protein